MGVAKQPKEGACASEDQETPAEKGGRRASKCFLRDVYSRGLENGSVDASVYGVSMGT